MCLIITLVAALVTTLIWYKRKNTSTYKMSILALMYWGASIMWTVDGIFRVAEKEAFLDLTLDDALLGVLVVFCGLVLWGLLSLLKRPSHAVSTK